MSKTGTFITRRQLLHLLGTGTMTAMASPFLTGCAVDPVTGRSQLSGMSEHEEISVDQKQSPFQFSSDYGKIQDRQLNQYIQRVGQELASRSHRPHMPFSFRGVNAAYINAYAFPGGSIAVTRGILVELENEAELAALLGHEIGHVNARHAAEQAGKSMLSSLLLTGASIATSAAGYSGAADMLQGFGQLGAGALLAHYSRENEREADSLGMQYMTRTGYNPEGMVGLMTILLENGKKKPSAVELMFSTHPMSQERYTFARQATDTTYKDLQNLPLNKERFMDMTASLRPLKGAITAMQNASTALAKKQYTPAREQLDKALRIAPDDYTALVMMAKYQFSRKKIVEAERYALKATRVYPEEAQAHMVVGVCGIVGERYEQAYQHFSDYDRLLPGMPDITFFQGLALEGMERIPEAAQYYNKYLQRVRKGKKAQYAYNRLKTWGYVK